MLVWLDFELAVDEPVEEWCRSLQQDLVGKVVVENMWKFDVYCVTNQVDQHGNFGMIGAPDYQRPVQHDVED